MMIECSTEAALKALIESKTPEGRMLDYKEKLALSSDADKKEFLADICSFANTDGGTLIYGISEERDENDRGKGLPGKIVGLESLNGDKEKLRIEESVRGGISPRLAGIEVSVIECELGPVLVVTVPRGWNAPYMVSFKNGQKFFARGNGGKFQMDISQIRVAFSFAESLADKIKDFHQGRVAKILSGSAPIGAKSRKTLTFHIVPLAAFRRESFVDLALIKKHMDKLAPISVVESCRSRVNLEGFLMTSSSSQNFVSYTQVYRNGAIEYVDDFLLGLDEQFAYVWEIEEKMIQATDRYFEFLHILGHTGPVVLILTLAGIQGIGLRVHTTQFESPYHEPRRFDRNIITLPDVVVEDLKCPGDIGLRPIFDSLYNAAGWDKCEHYGEDGRWRK